MDLMTHCRTTVDIARNGCWCSLHGWAKIFGSSAKAKRMELVRDYERIIAIFTLDSVENQAEKP